MDGACVAGNGEELEGGGAGGGEGITEEMKKEMEILEGDNHSYAPSEQKFRLVNIVLKRELNRSTVKF